MMGGPAVLSEGGAQRDHNHDLEQPLILQLRKIRPVGVKWLYNSISYSFLSYVLLVLLFNK